MKHVRSSTNLDKIGISASVICVIHCAFVPALITMLPLVGIGFLAKSGIESFMILISILIAGISLGSSYRLHQKHLPLVLLMIGIILIAVTHLFLPETLEPFIMPLAGLTIATAHYLNWNFSSKCSVNHSRTTPINQNE